MAVCNYVTAKPPFELPHVDHAWAPNSALTSGFSRYQTISTLITILRKWGVYLMQVTPTGCGFLAAGREHSPRFSGS